MTKSPLSLHRIWRNSHYHCIEYDTITIEYDSISITTTYNILLTPLWQQQAYY